MRATVIGLVVLLVALTSSACSPTASTELLPPAGVRPEQRDLVYSWLGEGDPAIADLIRDGVWDLPRFDPIQLDYPPTWAEDPYGEKYWRFVFYGLRPLRHLLGTYEATGDVAYLETLAELLESFANERDSSPYVADPHSTAFRTMVEVASYGALSRAGMLDEDLEALLRGSIESDAVFLADPINYQGGYNHGFTEAAALLLVAETFPDRWGWGTVARDRLDRLMYEAVDADGVEVENSPFYHFYVMGFAADIAAWAERNDIALPATFSTRLERMVDYATWILMPNGQVPLLGSSVVRTVDVTSADELLDLAIGHPQFEFVLNRGEEGRPPDTNSILFPTSGTAILRSGFGTAGTYGEETHVVFDVGPYRTNHSHLDALSVNVHASGVTSFPDSGLFSYEPGADFDYFHGTSAHNTVLVDGQDQMDGTVIAGRSMSGDGWSYQSGRHALYPEVEHSRGILLVGKDLVAAVDLLDASQSRDFAQLWHFAPELDVRVEDDTVIGTSGAGIDVVRIEQAGDGRPPIVSTGDGGAYPGWYSELYEIKVPAAVAGYPAHGTVARFVTLLAFGPAAREGATVLETTDHDNGVGFIICGPDVGVEVVIDDLAGSDESVTVDTAKCEGPP